ncbi:hypothetical protein LGW51_03065 [Streptococcus mutans]|uniref:hypothetical protein n=1 Tax=Streptococcus mutans TaxID=1309 RepID=UPI0002B56AAA|nr:hypothetical protein [Streptococcus mutans]ESS16543.1 hypothetical protein PLG01_01462 [Streptococcus mutans PKUSS-LG01]EMC01607.1 hypothetical protein SMU63_01295 [Streptococcus mutans T4]EMP59818.1 hypothetical protein D816_07082 [Streptococcus mutans 5DC8]KZM62714.1 hypothetical protein AWN62_08785 [Streptococcus mutans]MCB4938514.1 hypothetical protein [Streptococcus mutans]
MSSGLIGILFILGYPLKTGTPIIYFTTVALNSLDKTENYSQLYKIEKINSDRFWKLRKDKVQYSLKVRNVGFEAKKRQNERG